jgi:transposase, IS5 family
MTRELALAQRLLTQQRTGSNTLPSLYAPEVECISKGKAQKRYECGVKVGVVACLKKPSIPASHALPGRPYDGHTLPDAVTRARNAEHRREDQDRNGGQGPSGPRGLAGARIVLPGQRSRTPVERRWRRTQLRRRSVTEALIAHMKVDGLMD